MTIQRGETIFCPAPWVSGIEGVNLSLVSRLPLSALLTRKNEYNLYLRVQPVRATVVKGHPYLSTNGDYHEIPIVLEIPDAQIKKIQSKLINVRKPKGWSLADPYMPGYKTTEPSDFYLEDCFRKIPKNRMNSNWLERVFTALNEYGVAGQVLRFSSNERSPPLATPGF